MEMSTIDDTSFLDGIQKSIKDSSICNYNEET